ncbi:MAG: LptF/LptG family permease [Ignavibacteria bacterium]|nr:LptF/LptG family permease [Ignavibacteria bacterium]
MILHKYILRSHFLPFLFSVITLMCIFLLQFLMKFADRLVGKGLDAWVIIQLIVYNLSWMLVLVIPMATLVATLMAFGNLSQNNEITIMKTSGVSLYKMMTAPLIAGVILAFLLFRFNNDVLPNANHQAKLLMGDISRKKPTLSLEKGFFSQEVTNYAILARNINEKINELNEVVIYDYTNPNKINVVTAEKGYIYFSTDQSKLLLDLIRGEIHESDIKKTGMYRKIVFEKHRIAMNANQFSFQQTATGIRGERELSTESMQVIVDSLSKKHDQYIIGLRKETNKYLFINSAANRYLTTITTPQTKKLTYIRVLDKIKSAKNVVISNYRRVEWVEREIEKYDVEIYKKYALPAICIIFVFIGAPLGVMVKRGGFGVAASISLFFFLLYWAFLIGGEKLAERDFISPFIGMWAANILLTIAGLIITVKTNREMVTIQFTFIKRLIPKRFKSNYENSLDENS